MFGLTGFAARITLCPLQANVTDHDAELKARGAGKKESKHQAHTCKPSFFFATSLPQSLRGIKIDDDSSPFF